MAKFAEPPNISPLAEDVSRPFWSVMIPTYNCTNHLAQTLTSVLEQAPNSKDMQIEVIDNCSTEDNPEAVVKEIGKGRVSFFRQPRNVGMVNNFNTCIQRAKGNWVHILHDDDFVLPGFYEKLQAAITQSPNCGMVVCRSAIVNKQGVEVELSPPLAISDAKLEQHHLKLNIGNPIRTPAVVVKRTTYEFLGGYDQQLTYTTDWEMWLRIAANSPIYYLHEVLAAHRRHLGADTTRFMTSGTFLEQKRKAIEIAMQRLPLDDPKKFQNEAFQAMTKHAFSIGYNRANLGDIMGAVQLAGQAFQCNPTRQTANQGLRVALRAVAKSFVLGLSRTIQGI